MSYWLAINSPCPFLFLLFLLLLLLLLLYCSAVVYHTRLWHWPFTLTVLAGCFTNRPALPCNSAPCLAQTTVLHYYCARIICMLQDQSLSLLL